jgi:hypothetical protein
MRHVLSLFATVTAEFQKRCLEGVVKRAKLDRSIANSRPNHAWPARIRKTADGPDAEREALVAPGAYGNYTTHFRKSAIVYFAKEEKGHMEVGFFHPLDVGAGPGQRLLQSDATGPQILPQVHGDKSP